MYLIPIVRLDNRRLLGTFVENQEDHPHLSFHNNYSDYSYTLYYYRHCIPTVRIKDLEKLIRLIVGDVLLFYNY